MHMHLATLFIFYVLLLVVDASILHDHHRARFSRTPTTLEVYVRAAEKRCPNRKSKSLKSNPSPAALAVNKPSPTPPAHDNDGVIQVYGGNCAPNRATSQVMPLSGPNGHIDWMNCGFEDAGWNPPYVQIKDLITVPLRTALQNPESPFKACDPFLNLFEKYGGMYNIPPIMLASFAMQESSCQPWTTGGAGEQGLMQITVDKCGDAPGGNCKDPDFNIGQGAKYFSRTLADNGGNFFLAVGTYNGWRPGLTKTQAFSSPCCFCRNNGDYLMQFANGWLLNIDPSHSGRRLGKYFNLDVCRS